MELDLIIALIVLLPIVAFVVFRYRRQWKTNLAVIFGRILGIFLMVFGMLLLFPAFYALFSGTSSDNNLMLLFGSLGLIFAGHLLLKAMEKKRRS